MFNTTAIVRSNDAVSATVSKSEHILPSTEEQIVKMCKYSDYDREFNIGGKDFRELVIPEEFFENAMRYIDLTQEQRKSILLPRNFLKIITTFLVLHYIYFHVYKEHLGIKVKDSKALDDTEHSI